MKDLGLVCASMLIGITLIYFGRYHRLKEQQISPPVVSPYKVVCLGGVEYYASHKLGHAGKAALAVKFNRDGSLSLCEEK